MRENQYIGLVERPLFNACGHTFFYLNLLRTCAKCHWLGQTRIVYLWYLTKFVYFVRYPKTSAWDIMLGMNLWGTIYNMIFMFGWPGASGFEAVQFCKQHPEAAWDILMYCLCGAVGQNFIFLTISQFGSLTNTTITTTRKFVSIVVSSVLSGNPLSTKQWASVFMVFSGLSYQIYLKWRKLQRMPMKKKKST